MACRARGLLCSLVVLALLCFHGHGIIIDVYGNGVHVQKYEDDNAEAEDRAASLPSSPLRGQMYYAVPFRNACEPLYTVNVTTLNWVALIDNYDDCPDTAAWNLYDAGYGMMIAYSQTKNAELYSTPSLPRAIVTSDSFVNFLRDYTIIGHSPNASEYYIKVQLSNWFVYEQLFMIFGGVLLAAVGLSVLIFCSSIFCRTAVHRWRTRGLSRWRVRQLPKRKYRKNKEVCDSCSICLEEFKPGENLRVLPCDHIFHPSCVDEWLQKWNRTCPLCKSTIQRRRREGPGGGGGVENHPPSGTTDQEHAHLLSHEERMETSLGEHGGEGRDTEGYGAIGHSDNPLSSDVEGGGGGEGVGNTEGREQPPILERSVNVTVEIPGNGRGLHSNLIWNEDTDTTRPPPATSSAMEEQA